MKAPTKKYLKIDGHVHVYPMFNIERMLARSLANFRTHSCGSIKEEDAVRIWLLTEREDCSFFSDALNYASAVFRFAPTAEAESLTVVDRRTEMPVLWISAGRQYVTRERLEICALLCRFSAPDGRYDAAEAVRAVREAGGVAAVNWAPGKWMGRRGRVVENLLSRFSPSELMISDTTMRPIGWPTPRLMAEAAKNGFRILCGSDPLPFHGEENWAGRYFSLAEGDFDCERPAASLKQLFGGGGLFTVCGKRSSLLDFSIRQFRIMQEKPKQ